MFYLRYGSLPTNVRHLLNDLGAQPVSRSAETGEPKLGSLFDASLPKAGNRETHSVGEEHFQLRLTAASAQQLRDLAAIVELPKHAHGTLSITVPGGPDTEDLRHKLRGLTTIGNEEPSNRLAVDNQIGVFLTLDAVFPEQSPSINLLRSLLRRLNKSEVIITCARLNQIASDHLNEGTGTWFERHLRKQLKLVASLFNPQLFSRIEAFVRQHPTCTIFFRGQLLELIRWSALFAQNGESKDEMVADSQKRDAFAQALLTVNSLWERRVYRNQLRTEGDLTTRRLRLLSRFRRSISETAKGPDLTQAFVRGRNIICDRVCSLLPDFPESFRGNTGMTLDEYYSCLLLIVLRSLALDTPSGTDSMFAHRLFSPLETITNLQAPFSRLMELRSQTAEGLTTSLWADKSIPNESDSEAFEHEVIRERPIFRVRDDLAIVMDPVFLGEMATAGPLFMVQDVDQALRTFGSAFESHCSQLLADMYPDRPGLACRFRPSPMGIGDSGGQVQLADGLLDCGDRTILVESKAVWIREDKIESSAEEYIGFLRKKYGAAVIECEGNRPQKKGVAQLANSIRKLVDGNWKPDQGISICDHIVPVLLVYDSLIDAPLHPWFLGREFALLLDPSITNWQGQPIRIGPSSISNLVVITVDDLEALECSTRNFGLCELLQDYSAAFPDRLDSLHNYIVANRKYGDQIIYSERVRKQFSAELRSLGKKAGLE
jgi:hypothetical protein